MGITDKQIAKRALAKPRAVSSSNVMEKKHDRTPSRLTVADIPTADFARFLASPTISILVGPTRKSFNAHKDLLCHLVPYFASAFTGGFAEASTSEIYLTDEDPAAIEQFISWLYRGSKGLTVSGDDLVPLVKLYMLADMWCAPVLQNNLMDFLIDYFQKHAAGGLKTMTKVVKACYYKIHSLEELRRMLMFHTVELAFKVGKVRKVEQDLRVLLGCNGNFATDLAFWQVMHFGQKKNVLGKVMKKEFYV